MNKIIWTKKPGYIFNTLDYNEEHGFILRNHRLFYLSSVANFDAGVVIRSEENVYLMFKSYDPRYKVNNNIKLLKAHVPLDLTLELESLENHTLEIYKEDKVASMIVLPAPSFEMKEVNSRLFNKEING